MVNACFKSSLTATVNKIWAAFKTYKQLPYTFIYLFSFFLLADVSGTISATVSHTQYRLQGLNTTGTLISICQNDRFSFSFLQNTYLGLAQAITSTISTLGFWYIQKYWKISTKKMVRYFLWESNLAQS